MKYFHGTTSRLCDLIKSNGLNPGSYLTTSFDDASFYARTGGEWNLQEREENFLKETGENPRDLFETNELLEKLFPKNEKPCVILFEVPESISRKSDSGAEQAIMINERLSFEFILEIFFVEF